jgi:hypothetical protein
VTKYTYERRTFYHGRVVVSQGFHFNAPQTAETCAIAALLQSEMACRDNSPPWIWCCMKTRSNHEPVTSVLSKYSKCKKINHTRFNRTLPSLSPRNSMLSLCRSACHASRPMGNCWLPGPHPRCAAALVLVRHVLQNHFKNNDICQFHQQTFRAVRHSIWRGGAGLILNDSSHAPFNDYDNDLTTISQLRPPSVLCDIVRIFSSVLILKTNARPR